MKKLIFFLTAISYFFSFSVLSEPGAHAKVDERDMEYFYTFLDSAQNNCAKYKQVQVKNKYCDIAQNTRDVEQAFAKLQAEYHNDVNDDLNARVAEISGTDFSCKKDRDQIAFKHNIHTVYSERKFELFRYQAALNELEGRIFSAIPQTQLEDVNNLSEVWGYISLFREEVRQEFDIAEKALYITINSYSQMRFYYPIHQELGCLTDKLLKLRNKWEKFIQKVAEMPRKFINAARKKS